MPLDTPDAEPLTITANGLDFHALVAGPVDGPLVLLLHGFPETSQGWSKQIGPLAAAGLRVVAPDQRGVGLTGKPSGISAYRLDHLADDIVAIVRALGRERASVVGHDWGGVVAWHLARQHADVFERAAILDAPHPAVFPAYLVRNPSQLARSWYMAFFQLPWLPEMLLQARDFEWLAHAMTASSRPGAFTTLDLRAYREAWAQPGALTGMLNWYRAMPMGTKPPPDRDSDSDRGRDPDRIAIPVRLLWGDRDHALEPGLAEASIERCDAGELFHFPDATHWLQHEEPERVNQLLIEFLR